MNGPGHTRLIVLSVATLSIVAFILGYSLLIAGYQSGELFVTNAGNGISGLIGFLGGKAMFEKPTVSNPTQVETVTTELK